MRGADRNGAFESDIANAGDSPPEEESLRGNEDRLRPQLEVNRHSSEAIDYSTPASAIANRNGNYLFTVGNPSAGKSTLQNMLLHALHTDPSITLEYRGRDGEARHDVWLNEWLNSFAQGLLPKRTQQGNLQEFTLRVSQAGRRSLEFSFIEISGEDIRSIVPSRENDDPKLNEYLERYLGLPSVNRRFIFVSDATSASSAPAFDEDILFSTLIKHLLDESGLNLRRLNVLFVASKWDEVRRAYRSARAYFDEHLPNTRATVHNSRGRIKAQYIQFTIGDVVVEQTDRGPVPRVRRVDAGYIRFVASWIYHSFVGRHLKGYPRVRRSAWEVVMDFFAG